MDEIEVGKLRKMTGQEYEERGRENDHVDISKRKS